MKSELIFVLVLALVLDRALGEPPDTWHPTVFMGRVIDFLDRRIGSGALILLVSTIGFTLFSYAILSLAGGVFKFAAAAVILKMTFSWRGLRDYTTPLADAVERGDLEGARTWVPFSAGRNPTGLDTAGLVSTAVESIAESSVDSVVAPLLFFGAFSALSLEAGVTAAVFYRVVNTLDSMLGRPDNPKGFVPAKTDEALNLVPARLGAVLLLFSGALLRLPVGRGLRIFKRDRNKTASRNAGQTIAAMAGIVGVMLEKSGSYRLGDPLAELKPRHIYEALRIVDLQIVTLTALMVIYWI